MNNNNIDYEIVLNTHFSDIAEIYRTIRYTDPDPVYTIKSYLDEIVNIKIIDIGSGTGRYDELLLDEFDDKIFLTCVDRNEVMLQQLSEYLINNNYSQFETVISDASELPFDNQRFDAVVSFNAIHHFDLVEAINEMVRVTKNNGYIFIYTRTPAQNSQSIWGKYFPLFNEKETRLHPISAYENICHKSDSISIRALHYYNFKRMATLSNLIKKVNLKNYSTFNLYSQEEFNSSFNEFVGSIKNNYLSKNEVTWLDHNVLIVIVKKEGQSRNGK